MLVIIRWRSQQHFDACYEISAHCFILPSHPQKTARSRLDRHRSLSEHANRSPGCNSPSKQWWPCSLITASLHCLVCLECRETGSKSETFDPFILRLWVLVFEKFQLQMLLEKRGYFRWDPLVANFSEIETNFGRSRVWEEVKLLPRQNLLGWLWPIQP